MLLKDKVEEYYACKSNAAHFARSYLFNSGELTRDQYYWLGTNEITFDLGCQRRSCRTSTMVAKLLHSAIFQCGSYLMIAGPTDRNVKSACYEIDRQLAAIPDWLKQMPINVMRNHFEIGDARIYVNQASTYAIRGMSLNGVAVDNESQIASSVHEELMSTLLPALKPNHFIMTAA